MVSEEISEELSDGEVRLFFDSGKYLVGRLLQVLIKWLCSPINPLDINMIQGVYAVKRALPAIGGSEAAGIVVKV